MPWRMLLKIRHILMSMATEHRIGMMATLMATVVCSLAETKTASYLTKGRIRMMEAMNMPQ